MLKPNLVTSGSKATTNPEVVRSLVALKRGGKTVSIGEGSAVAIDFNLKKDVVCYTYDTNTLNDMQEFVFKTLGYRKLAQSWQVPLINLHTGDMVEVVVPPPLLA